MKVKWITAESSDGERLLKQHAVIPAIRKRDITLEEYEGNRTLCNVNAGITNQDEEFEAFDKIESEQKKDKCCRACNRIFKSYNTPNVK